MCHNNTAQQLAIRKRLVDLDYCPTGATTDCQDSSDATTADEKPKETMNGKFNYKKSNNKFV